MTRVSVGIPFQLYVAQPLTQLALIKWRIEFDLSSEWTPWLCFDSLPRPERIAGVNLQNGKEELYVTSSDGPLYVRRHVGGIGWTPWTQVKRPSASTAVYDIAAAVASDVPLGLLVVTNEGAFIRYRLGVLPEAEYGEWRPVDHGIYDRAALCPAVQDGTMGFVIADGKAFELVTSPKGATMLGEWQPAAAFSGDGIVDMDCQRRGPLADETVYATTRSGGLVRWQRDDSENWGEGVVLNGEELPHLESIAVGQINPGESPSSETHVFATDRAGAVWFSSDGGVSWIAQP